MCGICGCKGVEEQLHPHSHLHAEHAADEVIRIEQNIFAANQQFAEHNRKYFSQEKITAFNLMSSPGSGKTTLLKRTIQDLKSSYAISVLVGDQQTDHDAQSLREAGVPAWQINTGKVCHLDAHMVSHALSELKIPRNSLLFIENIGNLVCPAWFDLGQLAKVGILAVTEGENKPLKYPDMFRALDLLIITKIDLLPYVDFDLRKCHEYAKSINPKIEILELSAKNSQGLADWYQWLQQKI